MPTIATSTTKTTTAMTISLNASQSVIASAAAALSNFYSKFKKPNAPIVNI